MTSHQFLYPESCSRYPYVGKVTAGERHRVDFIYQFVEKAFPGNHELPGVFYSVSDIIGTPTIFPDYANCKFDFDISTSPWQDETHSRILYCSRDNSIIEQFIENENNYIEIEFREAVYPIRISVYEIYNPGRIIKIWAQDSHNLQWFQLWGGRLASLPSKSRLFSPPLKSCNFKTKLIKLQFKFSPSIYYTKLDAIMLIGISEKIFCSHNSPRTCFVDFLNSFTCNHSRQYHTGVCNLTADYENAHLDIAYLQKDFDKYCITVKSCNNVEDPSTSNLKRKKVSLKATRNYRQLFHLSFKAYQTNYVKPTQISNKSKKPSCGSFLMLSDEVQLMILKYLDLTSLCCMSQVNRHFNTLTRDSTLYTCLNVRNVRKADYICDIFCYFKSRCKKLQRLDLTSSAFPVGAFVEFLKVCSKRLTHLKLNRCFLRHSYIDYDPVFKIISETCKNLKELDLEFGCAEISNKALLFLKELEGLEYLNLRGTHTEASVLCKILEKNRRIRALHINNVKDIDTVLIELKNFCPDLEILNLHKAHHLTSRGINALAECRNLRKVDLRFNYAGDTADNLRRLLSSCQRLEYIYLSHIFLDDFNLKSLTLGKNLKELHFFWVALDDERPDQFSIIFERCSKLQKLRFYDCNTSDLWINDWKKRYPHVSMLSTSRKDGLSSDIIRLFSS